jgi:predicted SprT family Zn-dependent metalloprotease
MDLADARELAEKLISEWLHPVWTFAWTRSVTVHGECVVWDEEGNGVYQIRLSKPLTQVNPPRVVEDTIRHEIAHALNTHGAGHGPEWRELARRVGANPKPCGGAEDGAIGIPHKWIVECPQCGPVLRQHRLARDLREMLENRQAVCKRCCATLAAGEDDSPYVLTLRQTR